MNRSSTASSSPAPRTRTHCGFGGDDPERAYDALLARLDAEPSRPRIRSIRAPWTATTCARRRPRCCSIPPAGRRSPTRSSRPTAATAPPSRRSPTGAIDNELALTTFVANRAVSSRYPRDVDDYIDNAEHRYGLLDHFWASGTFADLVARFWPAREDRFGKDFVNPDSAPTILVIGGTHDPAAPVPVGRADGRRPGQRPAVHLRLRRSRRDQRRQPVRRRAGHPVPDRPDAAARRRARRASRPPSRSVADAMSDVYDEVTFRHLLRRRHPPRLAVLGRPRRRTLRAGVDGRAGRLVG